MGGRKFTTSKHMQFYKLGMHEYHGSSESLRFKDSDQCSHAFPSCGINGINGKLGMIRLRIVKIIKIIDMNKNNRNN